MSPLVSVCKPDAFVSLPTGEVGKAEFEYRDASEPLILLCKIEYPDGDIGDWLSEDLCVVDQDAFYKAVAKLRDSSAIEYGDHPSSCEAGMFVVWSKGKTVGFGTVLESADKHSCRITLTDGTVETQEMGDMFFAPEGQSMSTCQAGARVTTSHGNGGVVAADSKKVCMVKMDDGKTGAFMVGQLITNSAP